MAYCNIESNFLGQKINSMFLSKNRERIANLIDTQDFKDWFGNGRLDNEVAGEKGYAVFEPEQIHILGSKQDIEGFKNFVHGKTNSVKPGVSELFEYNPELANAVYEALGFNQMITSNDKVVFGHPTIGKSFLKKQGEERFITLDDDYANEVNAFVDANRGSETRQEYKGRKPKEYNEFMLNLFDRLKTQAQKEGKILFVSNTNILKERMSDFDKVITIPKEEFKRRFDERGATYGFEDWKSDIDATVAKVDKSKVISTTGYLADLFITPQQKQQAIQLYSQYLEQNPNGSVEQFKSWVDEFNRDNQKLNSNIQIFSDNNNGNFDSSSLKDDDLALMLFNQALGLNLTSANQLTWNNIKDNIFFEKEDGSLGVKNLAFVGGNLLSTKRVTLNNFLNQKGLFPEYKVFIGESVIYPNVFEVLEENEIIKQAVFENLFNLSGAFEQVKKELNNHSPETFVIETPHGKFTFPKRFASGFFKIASTVELLLKENQSSYIQDYLYSKRKKEEAVKDGKKVKPVITQTLTVNDTIVQNAIGLIGNSIIENAIKNNTSVKIQVFSNAEYSEDGIAGWYITTENTIYLHESMLSPQHLSEGLPLIAHELLHSVTSQSLLYDEEFSKSIRALLKIVKDKSNIKDFYGFKNEHEFLSEAFSSQEFRQLLKNTKFEGIEELSVWQKFINAILKLFGKNVKYTEKSTLATAEEILNDIINDNQYKIQYIKSNIIDKFNTHKPLSDFITQKSQEKLKAIQEIFNSSPELSKVGDVFSYAIYLDTIFPESKVKDIVYHGTPRDFEKFIKDAPQYNDQSIMAGVRGVVHFFSKSNLQKYFHISQVRTVSAILDIRNPTINKGKLSGYDVKITDTYKNPPIDATKDTDGFILNLYGSDYGLDNEGLPVLDYNFSFTNQEGERRSLMDFGINFSSFYEINRALKSTGAISERDGSQFVNNKKDGLMNFKASYLKQMIDTLNYYYDEIIDIIPSKSVTFIKYNTDQPIVNSKILPYSEVTKSDSEPYKQVSDTEIDISEMSKLLNDFSFTDEEMDIIFQKPSVSPATYSILETFLKNISPEAKIQFDNNMSENGIAYITDMLIKLKEGKKLQAMPEEVSHFFFELLDEDSPLKEAVLKRIVDYPIYSVVFQKYKDVYPSTEQIKREAVAQLIGEYIFAIANNDYSRIELLTKAKKGDSLIQRVIQWVKNLIKRLQGIDDASIDEIYQSFAKSILEGETKLLNLRQAVDGSLKNNVFFSKERNMDILESTRRIKEALMKSRSTEKANKLKDVIIKFNKNLNNYLKELVGEDKLRALKEYENKETGETGYQKLTSIFDQIRAISRRLEDFSPEKSNRSPELIQAEAKNLAESVSSFLFALVELSDFADSIYEVVQQSGKTDFDSIEEISAYRDLNNALSGIINRDLLQFLNDILESDPMNENLLVVTTITTTVNKLNSLETILIGKLTSKLTNVINDMHSVQNAVVSKHYAEALAHTFIKYNKDPDSELIKAAFTKFTEDLVGVKEKGVYVKKPMSKADALDLLKERLKELKVNKATYDKVVVKDFFKKFDLFFVERQKVYNYITGKDDIDAVSGFTYLFQAAHKNYNTTLAQVAAHIYKRRTLAETTAAAKMLNVRYELDKVLSELKKYNIDNYKAGESITMIDYVYDKADGKEKDGFKRAIVTLQKPYLNQIYIDKAKLSEKLQEAQLKYNDDKSDENYKALKELKKEFRVLMKKYFNGLYDSRFEAFENKWEKNEEFQKIKTEYDNFSIEIHRFTRSNQSLSSEDSDALSKILLERKKLVDDNPILREYFEERNTYFEIDLDKSMRLVNTAGVRFKNQVVNTIENFINSSQTEKTISELEKYINVELNSNFKLVAIYKDITNSEARLTEKYDIDEDENYREDIIDFIMRRWDSRNIIEVGNEKFKEALKKIGDEMDALKSKVGLTKVDELRTELYKELYKIKWSKTNQDGELNIHEFINKDDLFDRIELVEESIAILSKVKSQKGRPNIIGGSSDFAEYEKTCEAVVNKVKSHLDKNIGYSQADLEIIADQTYIIKEMYWNLNEIGAFLPEYKQIMDKIISVSEMKTDIGTNEYIDFLDSISEKLEQFYNSDSKGLTKELKQTLGAFLYGKNSKGDVYGKGFISAVASRNLSLVDAISNGFYADENGKLNFDSSSLDLVDFMQNENIFPDDKASQDLKSMFSLFYHYKKYSTDDENLFVKGFKVDTVDGPDFIKASVLRMSRKAITNSKIPTDPKYRQLIPNKKYRQYKVKDEYLNKQVNYKIEDDMTKWTMSNREDDFLPLSKEQLIAKGSTDFKYVNEEYYKLRNSQDPKDKLLMDYLNKSVKFYLQEQESKPDRIKTFLNLPVTHLDSYQKLMQIPSQVKLKADQLLDIFRKNKEADEEIADELDNKYDVDEYTQRKIQNLDPVIKLGMSRKTNVDKVNRDVMHALSMYIYNSSDFDARQDLEPFVKSLRDVMKSYQVGVNKKHQMTDLVDKLYKQMILEESPDNITNHQFFKRAVNFVTKMTAFKLMIDPVGGAINYIQANVNNIIESFSRAHLGKTNYLNGWLKADKLIIELADDLTKTSNFNYLTLLSYYYDFVHGEFVEGIAGRTSPKAIISNFSRIAISFRTTGEVQAQSAMALGIMDRIKVKNQIDGKMYPLYDIYKKEGDNLVLKDGFYEEQIVRYIDENGKQQERIEKWYPYEINANGKQIIEEFYDNDNKRTQLVVQRNGSAFNGIKAKIHNINYELHGNYAKISQTEASRYAVGKLAENMKRWFVSYFTRRMGRESYDVVLEEMTQGYYTTLAKSAGIFFMELNSQRSLKEAMKGVAVYATASDLQKRNMLRGAIDIGFAFMFLFLIEFGLGYDDDDPDRNKKLKDNSWLKNIMILIMLRSYAEHTAFIPLPVAGLGLTELTRNALDPLALPKNTVLGGIGFGILGLATIGYYLGLPINEKTIFYQKNMGSYWFGTDEDKINSKAVNYLLKSLGYTGSMADPAYYIRNFESLQARLK